MKITVKNTDKDTIKKLRAKLAEADAFATDEYFAGHMDGYSLAEKVGHNEVLKTRDTWYALHTRTCNYYEKRAIRHKRMFFLYGAVAGAVAVGLSLVLGYVV